MSKLRPRFMNQPNDGACFDEAPGYGRVIGGGKKTGLELTRDARFIRYLHARIKSFLIREGMGGGGQIPLQVDNCIDIFRS